MSRRSYTTSSVDYARAALARGPLVERRSQTRSTHYIFGRRLFSAFTIARLIQSGEAMYVGNTVGAL